MLIQRWLWAVGLGRFEDVANLSKGNIDLFHEQAGGIDTLFAGERRRSQIVTYMSPVFSHVQLGVSYTPEFEPVQEAFTVKEGNDSDMGLAVSLTYGDRHLEASPFFVGLGYTMGYADMDYRVQNNTLGQAYRNFVPQSLIRVSVQGKFGH